MKKNILISMAVVLAILVGAVFFYSDSSLLRGRLSLPLVNKQELQKLRRSYRVAVCLVKWEDAMPSFNVEALRAEMNKVSSYYKEVSFNKVDFDSVNFYNSPTWSGDFPVEGTEVEEVAEFCDPLIDFRKVDVFVIYPSLLNENYGSNNRTIHTDEGEFKISITQINKYIPEINEVSSNFRAGIVAHELGHAAFAITPHANSLKCGNNSFSENRDSCLEVEYGNPFDIMGTAQQGHFSGWTKYLAGKWVQFKQVVKSGTYDISAIESSSKNPQVLRIPFAENPICVDYRKPIGYDESYSAANLAGNFGPYAGIPETGCIFVELCSRLGEDNMERILIDSRPNSINAPDDAPQNQFFDACIHEDDIFRDEDLGVKLSFKRSEKNTAKVSVKMREDSIDDVDLELSLNGGSDICHFTSGDAEAVVQNDSEMYIGEQFIVKLFGITDSGEEVLIKTQVVKNMEPGEIIRTKFGNITPYRTIKAVLDPMNSVDETNEENNESYFERNCFV